MIGLVDRDHAAGVYLWHQLTATFATQSLMILIQIGVILGIMYGLYGMVINGPWVIVIALIYATSFTGMSIGKNTDYVCTYIFTYFFGYTNLSLTFLGYLVGAFCDGLMETILINMCIMISLLFSIGIWF